jgi:hypothetical protein
MSEWLTYSPSNFLMFSARVYYRLFALYNREVWPAQLLAIGLGFALLYLLLRGGEAGRRLVLIVLGALWIWVAWGFLWQHFATINWPVAYVAPVFALQGLALVGVGAARGGPGSAPAAGRNRADIAALALFAASIVLYPLIAPLMGRSLAPAEIFGLAPDPTALATLAALATMRRGIRWPLMIVPCLWCASSTMTLGVMGAADFFVPLVGALAAVGIAMAKASSFRPADRFAGG